MDSDARKPDRCKICGCQLTRGGDSYARPTTAGRSHATRHHFVAERFFGRSGNRPGTKTAGIFPPCPWAVEGKADIFCYECHEELLHNPVLLPEDIARLSDLVRTHTLSEDVKPEDRTKIAARVVLFHEAIARGLRALQDEDEQRERRDASSENPSCS